MSGSLKRGKQVFCLLFVHRPKKEAKEEGKCRHRVRRARTGLSSRQHVFALLPVNLHVNSRNVYKYSCKLVL